MSTPLMPPGTMPRPKPKRQKKTHKGRFTADALQLICADMERRWKPMHDVMRLRAQFYHRSKEVDPVLPDWLMDAVPYQSPILGKVGTALVARLTENHWTTRVNPLKDIAKFREDANRLEMVFEAGESNSEERPNGDLQHGLAMGLTQKAFGVVCCTMAEHVWPEFPDPEMLEPQALPTDPKLAGNYEPQYGEGDAASSFPYMLDDQGMLAFGDDGLTPQMLPLAGYKETDQALQERYQYACASAGWPWYQEVLDPCAVMFSEDRSIEGGPAIGVVIREVPVLDYLDRLRDEGGDETMLSLHDQDSKIPVYGEAGAPGIHEPSREGYTQIARVYQFWTRTEWYEVYAGTGTTGAEGGSWKIVKSGEHHYGRVPLFMAFARVDWTTADPVNRYRPALDDLYGLIAQFNRQWTLQFAAAEMNALPYFYWKRVDDGEPLRDTSGQIERFTRNAADAATAPDGYELASIEVPLAPEFMKSLEMLDAALTAMTPSTGSAEVEASTQPWTVRMLQAEASVEPRMYLKSISMALKAMRKMQTKVMSKEADEGGFAQPVVVFARKEKGGKVNLGEITYVEPKDIRSLDIDVNVDATSAQERVTHEMHGVEKYERGLITKAQLLEDYMGEENPDEQMRKLDEEELFETYIKPGMQLQMLRTAGFDKIEMGPDGQFYDSTGMPVMPEDVLARNGQLSGNSGQLPGQPTGPNSPMPPQMGDMSGLAAPNTIPLQGLAG